MLRRVAVLLAVVTAFSLRAALGPGAEVAVTPPATGILPGSQYTLAAASDGTDFLSLWWDDTPGRTGIYATVVSENGTRRPQVPLPLLRNAYVGADAVWTGSHYLVALGRSIALLDRDGALAAPLRDAGVEIRGLAWNGERALAITALPDRHGAALLDAHGNFLRTAIELPEGVHDFAASAAGETFILAWAERISPPMMQTPPYTRVRAARISAEGDVSAPVELLAPAHAYVDLASASSGADVGVAVKSNPGPQSTLHRYTIDAALQVEAEEPLVLEPYVDSSVDVVATPGGFAVAHFADALNRGPVLRTLEFGSTTPRILDMTEGGGYGILLESNGDAVMGFWGFHPARAAAFDASLTHMTGALFAVPAAPLRQEQPASASAHHGSVVVWNELGTLKLRRFDLRGNASDEQPLVVATNAATYYPAAVAFTGRVWLVAWVDRLSGVKIQRVARNGTLDGEPLTLEQPMGDLALASNGDVAALVLSSGVDRQGIRLIRFTDAGVRLDAVPIVLTGARSADSPAIAANGAGKGFLVAWSQAGGYIPRVLGKRLDASGNPIEAEPTAIAARTDRSQSAPRIASNGSDYVVAYVQFDPFYIFDPPPNDRPPPSRVHTKRVLASGALADVTSEQDGALVGIGTLPAIAFDGTRYVATFRKEDPSMLRLYVVALDAGGRPATTPRLLVRAESHAQTHTLAAVGGSIWAVYSRVVPELANVQRVFLRELKEDATRRRGARN